MIIKKKFIIRRQPWLFIKSLISSNNDELYSKAVEIVIKQQKVSTSYIQRYLQIGYNRAARIIEKMEEDGIIVKLIIQVRDMFSKNEKYLNYFCAIIFLIFLIRFIKYCIKINI